MDETQGAVCRQNSVEKFDPQDRPTVAFSGKLNSSNLFDVSSFSSKEAMECAQPSGFRLGHRVWLDVLRGIAVILVVAYHYRLILNGAIGVDIFFVLSGFLITSILFEEYQRTQTISIKNFYVRRVFRLLPLLCVLLVCYLAIVLSCYSKEARMAGLLETLAVATYTVNFSHVHGIPHGPLGYTWSLCVEEHFYLLWPPMLLVLLKFNPSRKALMFGILSGITAVAVWRAHLYSLLDQNPTEGLTWFRIYNGTDTRVDGLLVGCSLGLVASWNLLPTSRIAKLCLTIAGVISSVAIICCAIFVSLFNPIYMNGMYTGIAVMTALAMSWLLVAPPAFVNGNSWPIRTLAAIGKLSYGLYLCHLPIQTLLYNYFGWTVPQTDSGGWSKPWQTLLAVVISFAVADLCYVTVERPFLRLKKRFERNDEPAINIGLHAPGKLATTPEPQLRRAA